MRGTHRGDPRAARPWRRRPTARDREECWNADRRWESGTALLCRRNETEQRVEFPSTATASILLSSFSPFAPPWLYISLSVSLPVYPPIHRQSIIDVDEEGAARRGWRGPEPADQEIQMGLGPLDSPHPQWPREDKLKVIRPPSTRDKRSRSAIWV